MKRVIEDCLRCKFFQQRHNDLFIVSTQDLHEVSSRPQARILTEYSTASEIDFRICPQPFQTVAVKAFGILPSLLARILRHPCCEIASSAGSVENEKEEKQQDGRPTMGISGTLFFSEISEEPSLNFPYSSFKLLNFNNQWLFLRNQALIYRLLSLTPETTLEDCVRFALILSLLHNTQYQGARISAKALLPYLMSALLRVEPEVKVRSMMLLFWIACSGAMTAEHCRERHRLAVRAMMLAGSLGIEADAGQYRRCLTRYLFLEVEQSSQLTRLVELLRRMQERT